MPENPEGPPRDGPPAERNEEGSAAPLRREEGDERSTPRKDLLAAAAIGALSLFVMALSLWMPIPGGTLYSAPGLLPFLTGLTLLAMAFGLGLTAVRRGGGRGLLEDFGGGGRDFFSDVENRRLALLLGTILLYVILVDMVTFDLRIPLGLMGLVYRFSSFEFITIFILTFILRIFWRAPTLKCLLISLATATFLSAIFRYGFKVLLPGSA